jgi:RIO-like serine/threonine protein kinase
VGYAMEKVKGKTLKEQYGSYDKIPLNVQEKIFTTLIGFHQHKIVHGDFHGDNIMITETGDIKIIDPV